MNINTRDLGFVNFNGEEMQWVKFNGVTVYEAWRKLIASGVPPITLQKCKGVNLVDYKIYGNSVQESDNLFDPSITLTDNLYLSDTGTEVSNTNWSITNYIEVNNYSFTLYNVGGYAPAICAYDENKNFITGVKYGLSIDTSVKASVTITSTTLIKYVRFSVHSSWVTDGTINDIKLLYNPRPETPIEIKSVGDKTKNLFDKGNAEVLNLTMQSGMFVASSTSRLIYIPCKGATTYTITRLAGNSFTVSNSIEKPANGISYRMDGTSTFVNFTDSAKKGVYTTSTSAKYLAVIIYGASKEYTPEEIMDSMQIEEGDTATDYEPYGYKIPIKVSSKNVFDYKYFFNNKSPVSNSTNDRIDYKLKPNTSYVISSNYPYLNNLSVFFAKSGQYSLSNSPTTANNGIGLGYSKVIVTDNDGYMYIACRNSGSFVTPPELKDFEDGTYWLQIEEGTEATDYEPYVEPIITNIYLNEPLRKIGDYQDYIDFGQGKIIRFLKSRILTSDLGWITVFNETSKNYFHHCFVDDITQDISDDLSLLCSHYPITVRNSSKTDDTIGFKLNLNGFFITDSTYTNNEAFISFIEANDIEVVYPSYSEETIELPTVPTNKGTNIIEVDTSILPSNMKVKYYGKE